MAIFPAGLYYELSKKKGGLMKKITKIKWRVIIEEKEYGDDFIVEDFASTYSLNSSLSEDDSTRNGVKVMTELIEEQMRESIQIILTGKSDSGIVVEKLLKE